MSKNGEIFIRINYNTSALWSVTLRQHSDTTTFLKGSFGDRNMSEELK